MLRSFTTDVPFRGLAIRPFAHKGDTCVLGHRTVIYGRNGSGKTTFSELLRLTAANESTEGTTATASIRLGDANRSERLGTRGFPWAVLVYNRYYVQRSLELFLDGDGQALPILKLGATSVAATLELKSVRSALSTLDQWRQAVSTTRRSFVTERDAIEREVKSDIIAALSASDAATYNTARFQITRARTLLQDDSINALSDAELQHEIDVAKSLTATPISLPAKWPELAPNLRRTIDEELLGIAVESQPIDRLASNPSIADWIEVGTSLHKPGDSCAFCQQGTLTTELLTSYAQHFSEALDALRKRLRGAIDYLQKSREEIDEWISAIPSPESLLVDHRDALRAESENLTGLGAALQAQIDSAVTLIEARLADPLKPLPAGQRLAEDFVVPDVSGLNRLVTANNDACGKQSQRRKQAQKAVETHYGAVRGETYRQCIDRIAGTDRASAAFDRRETTLRERAIELEQSQQDTGRMANEIDADLREHFGYGHLQISVSEDGKGYLVKRGKKPAKRLSEGERNAIAFSYFLRTLEEEGVDPTQSIVVIDDPVTSMDKESLFATFALAEERTKDFAQSIFLTHNYEYFRLQLGHLRSRREKSEIKINKGDATEAAFPRVAILEITATLDVGTGERTSTLRKLPRGLLQHPSEYHYLFFKVAEAVLGSESETLPLLGNAARRLLDGFISFRAPNGNDFQARVDSIVQDAAIDDVLARRIVKFLHGQSHREEPRPTSALNFPSIENELKATLQFMQQADSKHFTKMCRSIGIAEEELALT